MAEFYVSVSQNEMAQQIAALLNTHNKLYKFHTVRTILKDKADYFVEVVHNKVVGCVGLSRRDTNLSEIKHVCVCTDFRQRGIARKLINLAAAHCAADYIYMTIRNDNIPSLKMAQSLGFVPVKNHWSIDHHVITVGRRTNYAAAN